MSKPVILMDMDGVLVNPFPSIIERVNEEFDEDYSFQDETAYDYYAWLPEEQATYALEVCWRDPNLYKDLSPVEGSKDFLEEVRQNGLRPVACSNPMIGHADSKLNWLARHGWFLEDAVLTRDKTLVSASMLIDDSPHYVEDFPGPSIIFSRPWNRDLAWPYRASSFKGLSGLVSSIISS